MECKITVTNEIPIFSCHSPTNVFSSHCPSTCTTNVLKEINCIGKMTCYGYKFFGFYHSDVERKLSLKESITNKNMTAEMYDLYNIQKRQGGPTSSLKYKQTMDKRNQKINKIVDAASFGDIKSYVLYLIENYPQLIEESILSNENFKKTVAKKIVKSPPAITLDEKQSSMILISWTSLTQREYKNVKKVLKINNVNLATYESVSTYIKELDVGTIHQKVCKCKQDCMSCSTELTETIGYILKPEYWFTKMTFIDKTTSETLFLALNNISESLYSKLDPNKKTLFIRMTGDNFRAAGKKYTEQISFSFLNTSEMVHLPYGQFITSLWHGKETRTSIKDHASKYHTDMLSLLQNGFDFMVPNGTI